MSTSTASPPPDKPQDVLIADIAEAFANGYTLGDLFNYNDRDYEAIYALGYGLYSQARYLDALKAFALLTMNKPLERRFVNAHASCLQMLNRHEDAIAFYSMASICDITDPRPTYHTAECLIALGRIEEAGDALRIVTEQCKTAGLDALKTRAEALLELLKTPHSSKEET